MDNRDGISKPQIHLFDFDGTITVSDTLLDFISFAAGRWMMLLGFALHSPLIILMKLGLYSNHAVKQRVFGWFFRGMSESDFNDLCERYAVQRAALARPGAVETLRRLVSQGHTVCVVSASMDSWVRPFMRNMLKGAGGDVLVAGTRVEIVDGRLTGAFASRNCYGQEKVARIVEMLPRLADSRRAWHVTAYGDSGGDREMLAFADEAHYKPFRTEDGGRRQTLGEVVRFGVVGVAATLLQYAVYWVMVSMTSPTLAMTIGYAVSFVFNFIASTRFTFRQRATAKKGLGFALSHAVNYLLQMLTLNLFLAMGLGKDIAPIPMFCVCVPVNFLLVRFFLKRG